MAPETSLKRRIHELLEPATADDAASRAIDVAIVALIGLNIVALVLESVAWAEERFGEWLNSFETFSVVVFTVEYVLRLWSATADERYRHAVQGRLRKASHPLMVIDALAILPFYLPMLQVDLRFLRAVRMLRIFRMLKIARYSRAVELIGRVLAGKKEELVVVVAVIFLFLLVGSSILYVVEQEAQPDDFSSIPAAMWWGIATLSTVGYGDLTPVTGLGKLVGAVVALLGIGLFALPAGILAGGFLQELNAEKRAPSVCPHCGREIHDA